MRCAIWYHLYKFLKWYKIAQRITVIDAGRRKWEIVFQMGRLHHAPADIT